jgi:glycosyltransferase involved in cell wall biosynthesis
MTDQDLFIICVGNPFNDNEIQFLSRLKIRERFITIKASDQMLATLYENALAFVYPSYYEGFGIPILEAFFMKCPVLLNDSSCFKEIASDAALYFNSKSMSSIRTEINKIISDPSLRRSLINKGLERVSHFSWESSAKATANVYHNLC